MGHELQLTIPLAHENNRFSSSTPLASTLHSSAHCLGLRKAWEQWDGTSLSSLRPALGPRDCRGEDALKCAHRNQ